MFVLNLGKGLGTLVHAITTSCNDHINLACYFTPMSTAASSPMTDMMIMYGTCPLCCASKILLPRFPVGTGILFVAPLSGTMRRRWRSLSESFDISIAESYNKEFTRVH